MSSSKRTVRVALLLCDTPVPAVVSQHGTYLDIFTNWLRSTLSTYPDQLIARDTQLIVDGYDVVDKMEYPDWARLQAGHSESYDVVMLTGSKHTAHDSSNPFVPPLIDYIRKIGTDPKTSHIKLIGICFGHQIIALAMGGVSGKGTNGWEAGVYRNNFIGEGRYWWTGDVEGQGGSDCVYLQQMHRDCVTSLPPNFLPLLRSYRYNIHSMVKHHPSSTPSKPLAQVFTVQGHPEFTPEIVNHILDLRIPTGVMSPEEGEESRRRAGGKDGTGGEGYGRLGWAIWRVMLQDLPKA